MRRTISLLVASAAIGACIGIQCTCADQGPVDAGANGGDSATDAASEVLEGSTGDDGATCIAKPVLGPMRALAPGTFLIGSPVTEFGRGPFNQDQVQVTLTHAFELGATEVNQAQWTSLCVSNPSDKNGLDCAEMDCPVGGVTWFDTVGWLNKLSEFRGLKTCYKLNDCTGSLGAKLTCKSVDILGATIYDCEGYRLPTEFEWEYAYRAGTTSAFYSGDITPIQGDPDTCILDPNLDVIGWYCKNSGLTTHPVGKKIPNGWGLYDMSGNALEWTHSKYTGSGYGSVPLVDPPGTGPTIVYGDSPSMRGGIFNFSSRFARAATRAETPNWGQGAGVGFRVARTLPVVPDAGIADAADAD